MHNLVPPHNFFILCGMFSGAFAPHIPIVGWLKVVGFHTWLLPPMCWPLFPSYIPAKHIYSYPNAPQKNTLISNNSNLTEQKNEKDENIRERVSKSQDNDHMIIHDN